MKIVAGLAVSVLLLSLFAPGISLAQQPTSDEVKMETAVFNVDPSLMAKLPKDSGSLSELFASVGIPFPAGSKAIYFPELHKLVIYNTQVNAIILGRFLSELAWPADSPKNLTVEVRMIRMPRAVVRSLFKEEGGLTRVVEVKDATLQRISELEEQKKVVVVCELKGTTEFDQPMQSKSVREFIYPTRFREIQEFPSKDGQAFIAPPIPTSFATRELGGLLSFTAVRSTDGKTIELSLNPSRSFLKGMLKWGNMPEIKNKFPVEQPEIVTRETLTNLGLKSGVTVLLSAYERYDEDAKNDQDEIELMFVTATLGGK